VWLCALPFPSLKTSFTLISHRPLIEYRLARQKGGSGNKLARRSRESGGLFASAAFAQILTHRHDLPWQKQPAADRGQIALISVITWRPK